ncbi:MAG TPA: deoxyribonuclease II family protein [Anaerolineae bacterium]|nr:deoxyribonuclease II family protein [Anaerolineae bacterium]
MPLSAMDDAGNPVDWWFMYKVAGKATTGDGSQVTGTEYVYFDANTPRDGKLTLSPHRVDKDGALPNTLAQVYGAAANKQLGWFFYNDENPIDGTVNGARGHTKGVLAFDLGNNSAFWLVQSTPKFPPKGRYSFPKTGMPNAQTLLCITLANADVAQALAKQMFVAQQPNVYLASNIPVDLANAPNDPRVKLMHNQAASGSTPVHVVIPFKSRGGLKFMSIAKNKTWGLDFYNDLVGPTLHENLDVETWEHDPTPPSEDSDKVHTVVDMKAINLKPLGIDIAWPEPDDHAKLAISDKKETVHFVCVGDINFTIAQRKRGGGTVAFQSDALWSSLSAIIQGVSKFARVSPLTPSKAAGKAGRKKSAKSKTATHRR